MLGWIILAVVVLAILWLIGLYNGLIRLKQQVDEGWADIDVQLKRRSDLIPNLVETTKGYAKHEKELFTKVTELRTDALKAKTVEDRAAKENMISDALKSIFAVAENYPELKASENFLELQRELSDTEDKIQAARRFYNGMVRDFNTRMQVFPSNLFAQQLGFSSRPFFEAADSEREPVTVDFSDKK